MNLSLCAPLDLRLSYILLTIILLIACAKSDSDISKPNLGKNVTQSNNTANTTTSSDNATNSSAPATPNIQPVNTAVATEGGNVSNVNPIIDTTHRGREGVVQSVPTPSTTPKPATISSNITTPSVNSTGVKNVTLNATAHDVETNQTQFEIAGKVEGKNSVRKNLPLHPVPVDVATKPSNNVTNSTEARNVTNPVKERPKKPLITEATYDEVKKSDESKHRNRIPSMDLVEEQKKHRSADYVVPIVAVILSVPLVAIIISVLYKRASEWWHHRHYRRMDFLIEGMYNN